MNNFIVSDKEPKNIIVRMPNWLGDLVMATPILYDLKHHWPNASLTAMCQGNTALLLQNDPNLNSIYRFEKPSGWLHRTQHLNIIESLRKGEYDLGLLLTNSFSSAWKFWRGHVRNRVGFKGNWRNFLLNQAVPFPVNLQKQHLVLTYKSLLKPLGIPESTSPPTLYVSSSEQESAISLLTKKGINIHEDKIVGINPGAAYGSAKCWLPERFKEVTKRLLKDKQVAVVYFGDPTGAPLVHEICEGLEGKLVNLAGKTSIRELLAIIQQCHVFLTNDSGPMHIAAALKIPLVALFGSTSDVKTGPYGGGTVIHKHVECSPCYKRVCPIDFRCMKKIEAEEVYSAIVKHLRE